MILKEGDDCKVRDNDHTHKKTRRSVENGICTTNEVNYTNTLATSLASSLILTDQRLALIIFFVSKFYSFYLFNVDEVQTHTVTWVGVVYKTACKHIMNCIYFLLSTCECIFLL